ncbi:hypothetical protein C1N69_06150 [Enterobacter sichuanensis]|nr:hypothetical protein C1N69_06150 [Enterobacter sichuanensis]
MLRYCLFLRSAPHHSEANISRCTVSVLPVIYAGATKLHIKPNCVYLNKQSNRRARNEFGEDCRVAATPYPTYGSKNVGRVSISATRQQKVRLFTTLTQTHQHGAKAKQRGQDPQWPVAGTRIWR